MGMTDAEARDGSPIAHDKLIFWGCFFALVATAFGFVVRGMVMTDWAREFNLSSTQMGEIFGVGLWPFAISIVLFSLIIDKVGYGRAMAFAFCCQVGGMLLTVFANGYDTLYWATFILALGHGTVEAVINPVVATMFPREKTKWLNILHAGWPGGLVLGGLLAIGMGQAGWQMKVALILIPVFIYGVMLFGRKFPVHERVAAGISYRDMLKEAGAIGAFIVISLMTWELGRVFEFGYIARVSVIVALTVTYGIYVRSLGRPLFIFLLLIMMPLAITELGTDSWITPLMEGEMGRMNLNPAWVLVYTSFIMMVLRFCSGPIVHQFSPLGLLAVSSVIAAIGLTGLSMATGLTILLAATVYGVGKTFFWGTMLGVVAEQFPRGGAVTLNAIGGVGLLSVGIIGAAFLGQIQDKYVMTRLETENRTLYETYQAPSKLSVFGTYTPLDRDRLAEGPEEHQTAVAEVSEAASKNALRTVAIFPAVMFFCYLALIFYFRSRGGYRAIYLTEGGREEHIAT